MKKLGLLFLIVVIVVSLFTGCQPSDEGAVTEGDEAVEEQFKAAFVYHAAVGDFGWFYGHDKAREKTEEALDWLDTVVIENVAPGAQAERVFRELCDEGYNAIVAASIDYEADVLKVAEEYPDVAFLICSGTTTREPNVESYFPSRPALWYLLGKVAGTVTETDKIGMIGSLPFPIMIQINNAWYLGAKSVNPDVTMNLVYLNTFFDPAAERDVALSLIDVGCDVIAQGTNTPSHVQAAEEMGVYAMSQWEDMHEFGPNAYLTGEVFNWDQYYIEVFTAIKEGTWSPRLHYPEVSTGIVGLATMGPAITPELQSLIDETMDAIYADPGIVWDGPIYDTEGNIVVAEGERLTDEDLANMYWHVQGIITSE